MSSSSNSFNTFWVGLEDEVGVLLVEAIKRFTGVVVQKDGVVGERRGKGVLREGNWGNGFPWGLGEAVAAGKGWQQQIAAAIFLKKIIECTTAVVVKTAVVASVLFVMVGSITIPELWL